MKIKIRQGDIIPIIIMIFSFMSGNKIFTGISKTTMWNFFYYGKIVLISMLIVFTYMKKNSDITTVTRKKISRIILAPTIVAFFYSVILWIKQGSAIPFISRGISDTIIKILAFMGGIALVIILKENTVKCSIIAAIITCAIGFFLGLFNEGLSFIQSLGKFYSVQSKYTELHEVAYVLGMYIVFMLFINNKKRDAKYIVLLSLSFIAFMLAWKRIGIAAIVITALYYILLYKGNKESNNKIIFISGIVSVFFCIVYVSLSTSNELITLMNSYNINLMGRNIIYQYFSQFCEFHSQFLGHGVGFVSRQFDYTTVYDLYNMASIKALHNDFMKIFIDIGFFGYIFWCIYWLIGIPKLIEKNFGKEVVFFCFMLIVYSFITYTTDNTEGYFNYQMHLSLLMTWICYNKQKLNLNIEKDKEEEL